MRTKMKKLLIIGGLLGVLTAGGIGVYLFNKPHQSIKSVDAEFQSTAPELVTQFQDNEEAANKQYLGKVVEVNGVVSDIATDEKGVLNITLQGGDLSVVTCQFEKANQESALTLKKGQSVSIKGICTGILMDVVLVDCVVSSNPS